MPVTASADPARRFAILTVSDPYTIDEWREAMIAILAAAPFQQGRALLVDRRSSEAPVTAFVDAMVTFFSMRQGELDGARAAVVVHNDAGFGMGRMTEFKAQLENPRLTIRPFREIDAAVLWLMQA